MKMGFHNFQLNHDFKTNPLSNSSSLTIPRCSNQLISCLAPSKTLNLALFNQPRWLKGSKQSLFSSKTLNMQSCANSEMGFLKFGEKSKKLAVKGAKVLVLEKYVIPGGSSGFYERDGYTFDVGSSVMFGFSDKVVIDFVVFDSILLCKVLMNCDS
ncbi:carotenoid isomerase [Artemisia annua]|uniref:Carotenoid isomerase n=1 Tax=Artemisia annua TaxID=35608 RepID=A0A2U1MLX1_ARTAN|nr:carotenoid isomerase [Artemisia annua]